MYLFIVNPNSRSGLGLQVWNNIRPILDDKGIEYQTYFTKYQRHATQIVKELTSDGLEHTLVVLGGDGTIGEVLTGINNPEKITLGYIPIGSGNDFARGLGIPKDYNTALDIILNSKNRVKLDIGVLEYADKKRRFGVSSGFGYDAAICHEICVSKIKKICNKLGLGKLAYVSLSLHCLHRSTPKKMTIVLDDSKEITYEKTYFATAMNLPYEGGGCKFCPKANAQDRLLDLIVVADVPKIKALLIIPLVFVGLHVYIKGVNLHKFKTAELRSEIPLAVHSDGEPIFLQRSLKMSLEDTTVNLIIS